MHHPIDRIAYTMVFVTTVVEHWREREIAQLHEQTIYHGATSRFFDKREVWVIVFHLPLYQWRIQKIHWDFISVVEGHQRPLMDAIFIGGGGSGLWCPY